MKDLDIIAVVALSLFSGFFAGGSLNLTLLRQEAVDHKCAEYDTKTGDFKWLNYTSKK